jgi:hypothetical protein
VRRGTASRGWMGSGWLSPVEAVGGDLSRLGLLRCRGGGPQGAAEDEGLSVLLGDRSMRRKGSTGACGGVAHRAEEEKGKGGVWLSARGRRKERGGGGPAAWRHMEECVGGHGGRQGTRSADVVASKCLPRYAGERAARVGRLRKMR